MYSLKFHGEKEEITVAQVPGIGISGKLYRLGLKISIFNEFIAPVQTIGTHRDLINHFKVQY